MSKQGVVCLALLAAACAGGPPTDPRYPPRDEGCDVKVFEDVPAMQTHNLGAVQAKCDDSVAEADCLRQLKDEACKLGGDVVWGVAPKPDHKNGKMYFQGRAAHTKN